MSSFVINGGKSLHGAITPQGAKNEALQVICATLLTSGKVFIDNIPDIRDVNKLIELLQGLGVKVTKSGASGFQFQADDIDIDYLNTEDFRNKAQSIRGSVMIMGPLLARYKKCIIPQPGGDKIGRRRLDTHFTGLIKLGAKFQFSF